jgi:3-oxosteroid 1-dehydrogenase
LSEEIHDVIVLGSGAAGMTAAIAAQAAGADVALYEKADTVGGTTAYSGGMVWMPGNDHMAEVGAGDSPQEAREYIRAISLGMSDAQLADAFIDQGPSILRWLEAETPVEFYVVDGFPDYHAELPGGKPEGGRSLECPPFEFSRLGDWADRITVGYQMEYRCTMNETPLGTAPTMTPELYAQRTELDLRTIGQSLAGRLLRGCLDRGIVPTTARGRPTW